MRRSSIFVVIIHLVCCWSDLNAQQQQQRCPLTRERKPWKDLTCAQQREYLASLQRLKENGIYDQFVEVHIQNEAASHGTPEFLPWHRWFIYQFESALRQVSADVCITLPYWDWESDAGQETRASIFDDANFGSFDGTDPRTGQCRWSAVGGGCLQRDMDPSFRFWSRSRLVGLMTRYRQYADDFPNNPNRNNGFRAALESGPHAAPHNMIGGNMVDQTSPNDPIFFLHHANVDRLWAMWQDYHGQSAVTSYSSPEHYEGRLLNAPMPFHGSRGVWDFRLNGGTFPSPQEVMSNSESALRVRYIQDRMIPNHLPDRRWFSSRPRFSTGCNRRRVERELAPIAAEHSSDTEATFTGVSDKTPVSTRQQRQRLRQRQYLLPSLRGSDHAEATSKHNAFEIESTEILLDTTNIKSWCNSMNTFGKSQERERWNLLCNESMVDHVNLQDKEDGAFHAIIASSFFVNEMVANLTSIMALEECQSMGNPANAREDWMKHMQLSNEQAAVMDCFHIPDEKEAL